MLKLLLGIFMVLSAFPISVKAYQYEFPEPKNYDDNIDIDNPSSYRVYYSNLDGFPHTYNLNLEEDTEVYLHVAVPERDDVLNNRSIIVVEKLKRGVKEVTRLPAKDSAWESSFDWLNLNFNRIGGSYSDTLKKGEYLVEVSTPENDGPYILVIGTNKGSVFSDYFELIADVYKAKSFYAEPGILAVFSPLISVPILLLLGLFYLFRYRKKYV